MFSILRDPRLTSLRIYGIRDKAKLARVARATVKVIAAKKTTWEESRILRDNAVLMLLEREWHAYEAQKKT